MSEVHFCNLCDQSVPLIEIEEGRARRVGDRVLCQPCRALVTSVAGGGRAGGAGVWLAAALGLAALLGAGFVWLEGNRADEELATELTAQGDSLGSRLRNLDERLDGESTRSSEARALLSTEIGSLAARASESRQTSEEQVSALNEQIAAFDRYVKGLEEVLPRVTQLESSLSVLEDRLRGHRGDLVALRDELDRQRDVLDSAAVAATPGEGEGADGAAFSPEVSALLRDLQSEDNDVRYAALEKLQPLQDPRLLPHVYPALTDPYEFNRFLAAHILGEWGARQATPHLIEALMDEFSFVREAAASSLRRLTGQNFGYDHSASAESRRRAYGAWKKWWEENGEEFLARESS